LFQTGFCSEECFDIPPGAWYILADKKRANCSVFHTLRPPIFLKMIHPTRLSIGRYLPVETLIHRVDARTKIVSVIGVIAALFLSASWHSWVAALLGLVLVSTFSGIPPVYLTGNVRQLIPILAMTLVLNGYMTPGEPVWSGYAFTFEGLGRGATLGLRLIVIVTMTSVLSLTTSPLDLADGIQSLCSPLARLRIPVHELALTATIALRLIPLLADEAARIRNAQLARGAATRGSWSRRIKDVGAILIPLFVAAFTRAERLADAMESRGYRGAEGRTRFRQQRFRRLDWAVFFSCAVFSAAAVFLDIS
jgi:energy-coupling factor transport system permease protein